MSDLTTSVTILIDTHSIATIWLLGNHCYGKHQFGTITMVVKCD